MRDMKQTALAAETPAMPQTASFRALVDPESQKAKG
jgi:hypothetical protein